MNLRYPDKNNYLYSVLQKNNVKKLTNNICKCLISYSHRFSSIVFCGASGSLIAPIVAYKLNKYPVLVRKNKEPRHCSSNVAGVFNRNFVIIDDFIESGKTMNLMLNRMKNQGNCIGIYLYGLTGERVDEHYHMTGLKEFKDGKFAGIPILNYE